MQPPVFTTACFGKLPGYADFVRWNAGGGGMLAFDDWLQAGLRHVKQRVRTSWNAVFDRAGAYGVMFNPAGAGEVVMGVLYPSRDAAGRQYPFLVAALFDRRALDVGLIPLLPILFSPFFERADRLNRDVLDGLSRQDVGVRTRQLGEIPAYEFAEAVQRYQAHLAHRTMDERGDGSRDGQRPALVHALAEVLMPYRRTTVTRMTTGVKVPLDDHAGSVLHDTAFWIDAAWRLAGRPPVIPTAFWPIDTQASPSLFLFFRQPPPKVALHLFQEDYADPLVHDLARSGLTAADGEASTLTVQAFLDQL